MCTIAHKVLSNDDILCKQDCSLMLVTEHVRSSPSCVWRGWSGVAAGASRFSLDTAVNCCLWCLYCSMDTAVQQLLTLLYRSSVTLTAWLRTSALALVKALPTSFMRGSSWNPASPPLLTPNRGTREVMSCKRPYTGRQAFWFFTGRVKADSMPAMLTSGWWANQSMVSAPESLQKSSSCFVVECC